MSSDTPATSAGILPKLSLVTMYAPPALGYSLIVWRYDRIRKPSTHEQRDRDRHDERERGDADRRAPATRRISSVAYADDDRLSDANTASAVGLPRRWWSSRSVAAAARAAASSPGSGATRGRRRAVGRERGPSNVVGVTSGVSSVAGSTTASSPRTAPPPRFANRSALGHDPGRTTYGSNTRARPSVSAPTRYQ